MSDKQFNSYIRLILSALKDMLAAPDKKAAKAQELLDNLQTTLED